MLQIFHDFIESALRNISGGVGRRLRYYYYKTRFNSCGANVQIDEGVFFQGPENISIGSNVWIDKNVIIIAGPPDLRSRKILIKETKGVRKVELGKVQIEKNVHIAPNVVLQGHGGIYIGDDSGVASGAKIYTLSHHYRNLEDSNDTRIYKFTPRVPLREQFLIVSSVILEKNNAIGLNSVILPGSVIHENSWVGVASTVSGEVPPNTIVSGNPAVVIKEKTNIIEWSKEDKE